MDAYAGTRRRCDIHSHAETLVNFDVHASTGAYKDAHAGTHADTRARIQNRLRVQPRRQR